MTALTLNLSPVVQLNDDNFYNLCQANRDLKLERTAKGELVVMSPTGGEGGKGEADLITDLNIWNRASNLGVVFSSSTGFKLPNGADRSPDASWIRQDRWDALTPEQRKGFAPLCPDFVLELRSESDNMEPLRAKMREYMANGARLGWLIDRKNKKVEIYRQGQEVEVLDNPSTLSDEDVLPGFVLDLTEVWS